MNEIIEILMERDCMTRGAAIDLINDTARLIFEALRSGDDPEIILDEMLGLEADYLDCFLI